MNKKILFVVDERKLGGVSVVLENLLRNLNLDKLDVTILVLHNNGNCLENIDKRINVIYGSKVFNIIDQDFKSLVKSFKLFKALRKITLSCRMKLNKMKPLIIRERKRMGLTGYDLEIAFKAGFCSLFVAYGDAKKKVNWVHEDYATYNRTKRYEATFKEVFNAFDKHIVVSKKAAKSFNDIYGLSSITEVIENYIDVSNIKLQADEDNIVLSEQNLNIVTLGRFCYEKGFDRLIDAVKELKQKYDELKIKVNILGYGDLEDALKDQIAENGLQDIITILNTQSMTCNAYSFVKANDIFIMPSRSESFGMTRIEALILGLPVITTDVANSKELINKSHGIIVANTTAGIKEGLEYLILNKDKLKELKENVKSYSYENKNEKIIKKIQKLLEE